VRDSAAFLDATNGRAIDTPFGLPRNEHSYLKATSRPPTPLRIAFTREPLLGSSMHPDCAAGLDRTVALCEELGHELHEAGPGLDNRRLMEAYFVLTSLALAEELNTMARLTGIKANARTLEDITFFLKRLGDSMSGRRFADAHADMLNATRSLALFFESYDVLLTPTMAVPPLPTGSMDLPFREKCLLRMLGRLGVSPLMDLALRVIAPRAFDYTPNTQLFNLSGFPAVSLPLAWNDQGLPIGMQFGASFGREDLLLSLAAQLEEARPWAARMPADFE
jgi:amidase